MTDITKTLYAIAEGAYTSPDLTVKPSINKTVKKVLTRFNDALEQCALTCLVNLHISDSGQVVVYSDQYGDSYSIVSVSQWIGIANMITMKGTLEEKLVVLLFERLNIVVKGSLEVDLKPLL